MFSLQPRAWKHVDQDTHRQVKRGAYYISFTEEENVIIWLPIYSSNPILRDVVTIGRDYF